MIRGSVGRSGLGLPVKSVKTSQFSFPSIVTDGLVLNYDFKQGSYLETGTTVVDLSNSGNDGTLINNPEYWSEASGCMFFNGFNQYIDVPLNSNYLFLDRAEYTLECWFMPLVFPAYQSYQGLMDRESNLGSGRDGWNLSYVNQNYTSVLLNNERISQNTFTDGPSAAIGKLNVPFIWHHIILSNRPNVGDFFSMLNGVIVQSSYATGQKAPITNASKNLTLMLRGGVYMNALLGAARIYSTALSLNEMRFNYLSQKQYYRSRLENINLLAKLNNPHSYLLRLFN